MFQPEHVAACCAAMRTALDEAGFTAVPVSVKCRLGVDDRDSYEQLVEFIQTVAAAGVVDFVVHARKADLSLNAARNRTVPPLRPEVVVSLVRDFPQLRFTLNGGVTSLEEVHSWIAKGVHGVMIGRRASAEPYLFSQWRPDDTPHAAAPR